MPRGLTIAAKALRFECLAAQASRPRPRGSAFTHLPCRICAFAQREGREPSRFSRAHTRGLCSNASRRVPSFANAYLLVRSFRISDTTHFLTVRATPDFLALSRPRRLSTSTTSLLMPSVQPISKRTAFDDFSFGICTHRLGTLVLRFHSSDLQPHLE